MRRQRGTTGEARIQRRGWLDDIICARGVAPDRCRGSDLGGSAGGGLRFRAEPGLAGKLHRAGWRRERGGHAPPPSHTAAAVSACANSTLRASLAPAGAAAGTAYYALRLTNVSASSCSLFGYPGVSFVSGAGGQQIGSAAARNPLYPVTTVVLSPNGTANATVGIAAAANYPAARCHPDHGTRAPRLPTRPDGRGVCHAELRRLLGGRAGAHGDRRTRRKRRPGRRLTTRCHTRRGHPVLRPPRRGAARARRRGVHFGHGSPARRSYSASTAAGSRSRARRRTSRAQSPRS